MTQKLELTRPTAITAGATNPAAPAAAYVAGLRPGPSQASARADLAKIARILGEDHGDWRTLDWRGLNAANVAAIMAKVDGAPATRRRTLSTLKGVARTAWRMGLLDGETLARIRDIAGDTGSREPAGREVEDWEIAALIRTCASDPAPAGTRDASLIALAWSTGARRAELIAIRADAVRADAVGGTADGYEIRVIGKRNKQRVLYVTNGASKALADWLTIRGNAPGALYCAIRQGGNMQHSHHMTTTAAHKILNRRAIQAGLTNLGWHDFRRTFAGELLQAGEDIATVAALMGHASVNTTAQYDRRPAETRRRAARKISTPYFGRTTESTYTPPNVKFERQSVNHTAR